MIDFGVAFDKLASMNTADEIADYFRYEGITGYPTSHVSCPIANWMSQQTGGKVSVADVVVDLLASPENLKVLETTGAMLAFIRKFDSLDYPDLLSKEEA